ncbi:MAG: MGMT family protein [Gammaproteobacteria bacterium]|nr:MGMT family protein [Gammaproteobacteria bacterium]NCW74304.1 MGMT family protein [Gammaproteobacteria bacterium]NCX48051.1 MGMT family protein [Gammaproteobacteria bacterium]
MTALTIDTSLGLIKLVFEGRKLTRVEQASSKEEGGQVPDEILKPVIDCIEGRRDGAGIPVKLEGSEFQIKVWEAMRQVPPGQVISYSDLAKRAGNMRATRAAASACGQNPCAIVIPCHRIVRRDRGLGGFFWGLDIKRALLTREGIQISHDNYIV